MKVQLRIEAGWRPWRASVEKVRFEQSRNLQVYNSSKCEISHMWFSEISTTSTEKLHIKQLYLGYIHSIC